MSRPWLRRAWSDPWAWAPLLAVLPLLMASGGAPLGEPLAGDFYFLRRVIFPGPRPLLDGGGSPVFWRPLARQVYFGALGPLVLDHPGWIVALHALLLGVAGVLLYRALRPRWSGAAAAAAASFPVLVESARMLIGWASFFQDVGAFFFAALAVYQASRSRLAATLASLLAALLCKEIAVAAALVIPWMPGGASHSARQRLRWAAATAALLLVWGAGYLAVVRHAHLRFEHEADAAPLAVPLLERV